MQRNSYLVTATRDAEKVPDIVQLARGSLINEIITVVVISLNLNPGRVGPPNGHLYHLVQRFFYGRGVLFMPRSSQQEINQTCTTIPQTVLQESNKMEIWTLSDTEKKKTHSPNSERNYIRLGAENISRNVYIFRLWFAG